MDGLSICPGMAAAGFSGTDPHLEGPIQTPGRIHKVDPPEGSVIYTIGVFESRLGGSTFWILPLVLSTGGAYLNGLTTCRRWQLQLFPKCLGAASSITSACGKVCLSEHGHGRLSKLWSPFVSPKYYVPYCSKDPKRDHNFDNHPHACLLRFSLFLRPNVGAIPYPKGS